MGTNKRLGELMRILNALETIIYVIVDSNYFLIEDKKSLVNLLRMLANCSRLADCISILKRIIDFTKKYTHLLPRNEQELLMLNLEELQDKKIQKLMKANLNDSQFEYIIKTINAFAIGIIQEIEDSY